MTFLTTPSYLIIVKFVSVVFIIQKRKNRWYFHGLHKINWIFKFNFLQTNSLQSLFRTIMATSCVNTSGYMKLNQVIFKLQGEIKHALTPHKTINNFSKVRVFCYSHFIDQGIFKKINTVYKHVFYFICNIKFFIWMKIAILNIFTDTNWYFKMWNVWF